MIGITMADHSRHRCGKNQDRGDHLERCGDPETRRLRRNMKSRIRSSLRMRKRLRHSFMHSQRIFNVLFLNILASTSRFSEKEKTIIVATIRLL